MSKFPKEYSEYYYYCKISNIEEAQQVFKNCNTVLFDENNGESVAYKLLKDKSKDERKKLLEKFNMMYNDFLIYSDELISGEKINDEETYVRYIHNLMRISNEMIAFTSRYFTSSRNRLLAKRYEYEGKMKKLLFIINENRRIPYIINSNYLDDYMFENSNVIMTILTVMLSIITYSLGYVLYYSYKKIGGDLLMYLVRPDNILVSIGCILCFMISIWYWVILIKKHRVFKSREIEYMAKRRNRGLVYKPFKSKKRFKDELEVINILNNIRK